MSVVMSGPAPDVRMLPESVRRVRWPERQPTPAQLLAAWPIDEDLLALGSGTGGGPHGRWSILARPGRLTAASGAGVLPALDEFEVDRSRHALPPGARSQLGDIPFVGGWIGFLGFECGEHLEPAMVRGSAHPARRAPLEQDPARSVPDRLPDLWLARCDAALVHDSCADAWFAVGAAEAADALLSRARSAWEAAARQSALPHTHPRPAADITAATTDEDYSRDVARTIELIHAGDLFQANIARRFAARVGPDPRTHRAIGVRALGLARYGACLEIGLPHGRSTLASVSPELFLRVDRDGTVTTRPIKGTIGTGPAACAPPDILSETFARDAKERAELHMIVDLMRNDLARVCEPRTVRVGSARHLEHHPTVLHGVAEVTGTLRPGTTLAQLLRATFPPGSVTGAPKVRAVQVIRELEPTPRGPYCGAIGMVSDCGAMHFSVAIRTATITPSGDLSYWAGCGIVAESVPEREVAESHAKAAILGDLVRGLKG